MANVGIVCKNCNNWIAYRADPRGASRGMLWDLCKNCKEIKTRHSNVENVPRYSKT